MAKKPHATAEVTVETNTVPTAPTTTNQVDLSQYNWDTLVKEHGNISKAIRYLAAQNLSRSQIAKVSGKKYQHVRQVLNTPIKTESATSSGS